MLEKINTNEIKENITGMAKGAGFLAMTGAMTLVAVEVGGIHPPKAHETHETDKRRAVVPAEAEAIVPNGHNGSDPNKENVRRAEETGPHYVSYGAMHRTPGRSGAV